MPADETTAETTVAAVDLGPKFRIGAVLGRAFSTLFRNIVPFGLLAIIVYSPYIVLISVGLDPMTEAAADPATVGIAVMIAAFGYTLLYFVLNAAIVYGTVQDLRGAKVTVGACLGRGLATIFPVLGAGLLVWLATGLGMILLFIPGIIAMVMLWVAIPVAVVERCGPVESLSRSLELTKGNRWRILGIIGLVILIQFALNTLSELVFGVAAQGGSPVATIFGLLIGIFFALLFAVISAVGYHGLRAAKEGTDIEQIAAVFD